MEGEEMDKRMNYGLIQMYQMYILSYGTKTPTIRRER